MVSAHILLALTVYFDLIFNRSKIFNDMNFVAFFVFGSIDVYPRVVGLIVGL